MSDRDRWDLRGPVRTADIHRTWRYWKRGSEESDACELTESGDHSIVDFRPDGAISRHWHQNLDGSEVTDTHAYDAAGRLVSVQFESSTRPGGLRFYEYDQLGRLARLFSRDPDGNDRTFESYSYDAEGRKTKTYFADRTINYGVDGSIAFYSAPNAATITTIYNQADRPTELLFHDAAGVLLSRVVFRYDESGNLTEETQTHLVSLFPDFQDKLPPAQLEIVRDLLSGPTSRRVHRYDALGRRIETLSSMFGSLGSGRETLDYNQYGDLIAQTAEDEEHDYGFNEEGQLASGPARKNCSEARFRYEYDTRGNWISQVIGSGSGDNQDFSPTSTERRTLTYFDPI
jgi:YD repeat-containing protein